MMASHALYRALKASKAAFGAWITLPGTHNARIVVQSSPHLSWVMIDCEHGLTPLNVGSAETIQAIAGMGSSDISPLVRIPATGTCSSTSWMIKSALDAGARGVLVPMVSNPEKVKEIVSDCRFPPAGRRGFGNPITHLAWNVSVENYLESANESITIMVQIENKEGVENVEDIASVDGLDVLFIGPYDLSLNLGYPPPFQDVHPEVEKVIQTILEVAHRKGKKCGIYCSSGEQAFRRAQQGFDMINVTSDSGAMSEAIASNLKAAVGQNV
ncbi:Pyruvate/Phosphoenolpyruvate kinase-like domain-containing protein [Pisolithus croceorrhizus]|nr:Pyruvate/Phosphoenolpyruvate kinase-like domain-containing protein [Pisolithus croceorrhizus]